MYYYIYRCFNMLNGLGSYKNNYYYIDHQHYNHRDLFFDDDHDQGKSIQGICVSL